MVSFIKQTDYMRKKKKDKIIEYCTVCGSQMEERKPITADNFGYFSYKFHHPYDEKTGKKRMRRWIACPKYKDSLFSNNYHNKHAIGEEYLI